MNDKMPQKNEVLDSITAKTMPAFAQVMPRVVKEHGKSLGSQVKDMIKLCMRGNKLLVDEYYQMKLFDDKKYSADDKKKFVGLMKSREIWSELANLNPWYGFLKNKFAGETLLGGFGLPVTKTLAIVKGNYPAAAIRHLDSVDEMRVFFKAAEFPMFGKPSNSNQSLGSVRFASFNAAEDSLVLSNGNQVSIEAFWNEVVTKYGGDYLLQTCVEEHPMLKQLCGGGLPTLRVVTIERGNGPEIYRTCIKLTGSNNVADNFWRAGNMLAPVDVDSGEMGLALTNMGIDGEWLETHPDTSQKINGTVVPYWQSVKETALEVAGFYKNAYLLGFDIAVTENGPVVIEVNVDPHLIMLQVTSQKGVLDEPFLQMIDYARAVKAGAVSNFKAAAANEKKAYNADLKEALSTKAA